MLTGKKLKENLKKVHLLYVTDKRPGIMRQKIGKSFSYYNSEGKKITDSTTLNRIKKLVIPPAWENVWICDSPKGHLQATGYELFQYVDDGGERHTIDSQDVNDYLKEITGKEISAKDFRTWGGTLICAKKLQQMGKYPNQRTFKKNVTTVTKVVSTHLRNTPAVCRSYYIHPSIIRAYQRNALPKTAITEENLITLLKKYPAN